MSHETLLYCASLVHVMPDAIHHVSLTTLGAVYIFFIKTNPLIVYFDVMAMSNVYKNF